MNRQKFNLHTHTARCGHADGLDVQYIESAILAGFDILGFSEHIPYKEMRLPNCRMFYEQKDEYFTSIRKLQKEYADKIQINVGFEIEYMDSHIDHIKEMYNDCDYMILGQHCKYIGYEYDCFCSDSDVLVYVEQIEKALATGLITYVAHPDYYMLGRREFSSTCAKAAHRIAKASLAYDTPLEINLNGFHYGKKQYVQGIDEEGQPRYNAFYPYPFRFFWEIIASYGCKVLFGYDAHSPITLLEKDREQNAMEILKGLELNFIHTIPLK